MVCAAAIQHFSEEKNDIKIDIYEAAPKFTEIGAGVGMYLRPWKAMKTLGFEEALCKLLSHVPREDENRKLGDYVLSSSLVKLIGQRL